MELFIFYEFSNLDIIEEFKILCPNVKVTRCESLMVRYVPISIELHDIYRTNAKLLFRSVVASQSDTSVESTEKDDVISKLKSLGFVVRPEHQLATVKEKRLIPSDEPPQCRKCECGKTDIKLPQPPKEITVLVKRPFTDRVILEFGGESK